MTLGEMIKRYRKENDLSMDAFAKRSGISKAYISLLEKNKHPKTGKPIAPSIQSIKQAADGMNMEKSSQKKKPREPHKQWLSGHFKIHEPEGIRTPDTQLRKL